MSENPSENSPASTNYFVVLSTIARLSATTTDLHSLLNAALSTCLDELPLQGAIVWLRSQENDLLTPSVSRVPAQSSTNAISEDDPLLEPLQDVDHLVLSSAEAESLILLPDNLSLALVPMFSEDVLLGLLGFVGERPVLTPLEMLLEASANVLSGAVVSAWLRRQQADADDVAETLFRFAEELRAQPNLVSILGTANNLALRLFDCDWSAVYSWQEETFTPIQIMTRTGEQELQDEPALPTARHPLLEVVVTDPELLSISDLRDQPNALPPYLERHNLRGVVLVPLQKVANSPLGLLVLGYRTPLTTFSRRYTALAQGLAHMVAVALDRTIRPEHSGT